ncbi:MAG TPA: ferritin-like domain-containing protein, partial [Nitrososphaerales archaeon]|nr:ferritin-like domain-containing protein [Nitrososphaerales archaeon]
MSDSGIEAKEPTAPHQIRIQSREDLVSVLSEASALEHMIMCEYLFTAFSLKRDESEGVDGNLLEKLKHWEEVIDTVAVQEMTHLALVNNMLVAIGSGPYFQHPNFPQPSRYFSPNIRLALVPFGEQALRHFLYLERPEGMSIEGVPGFEVLGDLNPPELKGGIVPQQEYFSTVGSLYRGIEKGFGDLVDRYGEDAVFIGADHSQASEEIFGLSSLFEVKDLASARKAVEGIVEMGEGARGDWTNAHFGMFLRVFKEFMDAKKERGDFRPTRPVVVAFVRPPLGQENVTLITDPFTSKVADLFNASYGLAIHTLSRFYAHQKEYPDELQALADTAVGLMEGTIESLGVTLTSLPVGSRLPGVNAGPSFELQNREYL